MAPLTWRNVDQASFTGANQMWEIAATLMNKGFDSARTGLKQFNDNTTNDQSAALMQQIIAKGNDRNAIAGIIGSANPAFISPEALKFANNQPGVILEQQGQQLNNVGTGLVNNLKKQSYNTNEYNFGRQVIDNNRKDADYALMPEALKTMQGIRAGLSSGIPAEVEAAQKAQGDFLSKYGRTLGITNAEQVGQFATGNLNFEQANRTNNLGKLEYASKLDESLRKADAKSIAANTLGMVSNDPDRAVTAIKAFGNIDPETKVAALAQIETYRAAMPAKTAADELIGRRGGLFQGNEPRPVLPENYSPVIMQNNGVRRLPLSNNLTKALESVLPKLGLSAVVISGGQDPDGPTVGSTRHDHGNSGDIKLKDTTGRILSWENPNDVRTLQKAVAGLKEQGLTGFGAGPGYMNPETTHVGYGKPAVWGAKGGAPYQALLEAYNNTQSTSSSGSGEVSAQNKATASSAAPKYKAAMDAVANNQQYNAPVNINESVYKDDSGRDITEKTFTKEINGAWFNIPNIINNKPVSEAEALAEFKKGLNPAVGVFQNKKDAEVSAESRVKEIDAMLAAQAGNTNTANSPLTETLTPEIKSVNSNNKGNSPPSEVTVKVDDDSKPIKISDRYTVPAIDPNAQPKVKDAQAANRVRYIERVLEDIALNTTVKEGASPLGRAFSSAWNFIANDADTSRVNSNRINDATDAVKWFRSNEAKAVFSRNANKLTEAVADPVAFYNKEVNKKPIDNANPATILKNTIDKSAPKKDDSEFTRRSLDNAESVSQLFSIAKNTNAFNATNDPNIAVREAIKDAPNNKEDIADVATRLTKKDSGKLASYTHPEVTQALKKIVDKLGVKPSVAGSLLAQKGTYSDGFLGFGKGYSLEGSALKEMKQLYDSYQSGNNANRGISAMNTADLNEYQVKRINNLEEQVNKAQEVLKTAINDPNTPPEKILLYERELAGLVPKVRTEINKILSSGAVDNNIRNKTSK
jgi:hypothetical protein